MATHELSRHSIMVSADGINLSAPWRLAKSPDGRALTTEQEADLASRFELEPERVRTLSRWLDKALDPSAPKGWIPLDRSKAEEKGGVVVRKALARIAKDQE